MWRGMALSRFGKSLKSSSTLQSWLRQFPREYTKRDLGRTKNSGKNHDEAKEAKDEVNGVGDGKEKVDYSEVMYSRRHKERADSLSPEMLQDRLNHKKRIETVEKPSHLIREIIELGHGKKTRLENVYTPLDPSQENWMSRTAPRTATGAGGLATLIGTATNTWPVFKHMLPEIAFAGHSNSGKSTLVNAIIGKSPRGGLAAVSARAGWTDQIHFYQLGKKPPLLTLVDLPGYGHAVANPKVKKAWKEMTHSYMKSRLILSRVYVLVDCMRGLCEGDLTTLTYLEKNKVQWKVILTKCDQLHVDDVAKSLLIVYNDLLALKKKLNPTAVESPVSTTTKTTQPADSLNRSTSKKSNTTQPLKGNEESDDESEFEGEFDVSIKDLMNKNFDLSARLGSDDAFSKSKSQQQQKTPEKTPENSPEKKKQRQQLQQDDNKEALGKTKFFIPNMLSTAYEDEDEYTASAATDQTQGNSNDDTLVITEEGEIVGGCDLDFNNLSSKNYAIFMRSAKNQLLKMQEIRDREIAEKGSVDYELIHIDDVELTADNTDDELDDVNNQDQEEDQGEGEEKRIQSTEDDYVDNLLKEILKYVVPVSATTGAGINRMWEDIRQIVNATVTHPAGWESKEQLSDERVAELRRAVREHQAAAQERRRINEGERGESEGKQGETGGGRGEGGGEKGGKKTNKNN